MGFGSSEFGSVAHGNGMAVTGQSLTFSPTQVPRDGGSLLTITGIPPGTYRVHFGPNGSTVDPVAYQGTQGAGKFVVVASVSDEVELWLPPNPVGASGLYFDPQGSGTVVNTGNIIAVVPHPFRDKVLDLRALSTTVGGARLNVSYTNSQDVERPQT